MTRTEIKRYGKIVVLEHWLAVFIVFGVGFTGMFLARDWFIHEFHIHGAENIVPTPDFALDLHKLTAFGLLALGAIHLIAHVGQKEKPILPKRSFLELKAALYSLMFLVFLTKKQERGSGGKYLKSQRIMYGFTIYVMGLGAITGFLHFAGLLEEYMLIVHLISGILVILVVVHHLALNIRKHDKVALRCVFSKGTMPEWYVKKNHRAWYDELVGRGVVASRGHKPPKKLEEKSEKPVEDKKPTSQATAPGES